MRDVKLSRDPYGRLVYESSTGERHVGVVPVRAFPVSAPDAGLSLVASNGHELLWIHRLEDLAEPARREIEAELSAREFTPGITAIREVSGFVTPCTWEVDTDRGRTTFVLKGEEDIRRMAGVSLLIADKHGIQYLIRDPERLDKKSRRFLDRFL